MSLKERLSRFEVFADFNEEELDLLDTFFVETVYEDGDIILRENAPSTALHFVLSGRVKVYRCMAGQGCGYLSILEEKDVFGEVSFADQKNRSASVSALGRVVLASFAYDHFEVIRKQNPAFGMRLLMQLMKELAKKFRVINKGLDLKSADQIVNELVLTQQQVKITTMGEAEYICIIKSSEGSEKNPFLTLDLKGQTILLPVAQIRSIVLPNKFGKF